VAFGGLITRSEIEQNLLEPHGVRGERAHVPLRFDDEAVLVFLDELSRGADDLIDEPGEVWLHAIKHDGFRVIARKDGNRVQIYRRPGNDLTYRFPLIVESLARLRSRSCIIDGSKLPRLKQRNLSLCCPMHPLRPSAPTAESR
jgi:hypothetical protein